MALGNEVIGYKKGKAQLMCHPKDMLNPKRECNLNWF